MSCVMCHISYVTCSVSRVTCHMSKKNGQSVGASRWRVCHKRCKTFQFPALAKIQRRKVSGQFSWEDYFIAKSGQGGKLRVWADYQNKGTDQKTDGENKQTCQREAITKENLLIFGHCQNRNKVFIIAMSIICNFFLLSKQKKCPEQL